MTTSKTFSVTVTNVNGCSATDSVHVTILPLPGFSTTIIPANGICVGDSATITCSNAAWNYSWTPVSSLNISTGDSVFAFPVSSTTYSITAVDTNGCVSNSTATVTVFPPLAPP